MKIIMVLELESCAYGKLQRYLRSIAKGMKPTGFGAGVPCAAAIFTAFSKKVTHI